MLSTNFWKGEEGLFIGSERFLLYLELSSWAQMNSVSSSSSGDCRELACRGTDSQGAPVSVASPSIARPEAIHQSTTAGGRTHREPPSVLPALLWPDMKQSITQPQQGDRLTGSPPPVSVASPSIARPEAIHHSTTAEGQTHRAPQGDGPNRPVDIPSMARPEAIHQSTTVGRYRRTIYHSYRFALCGKTLIHRHHALLL